MNYDEQSYEMQQWLNHSVGECAEMHSFGNRMCEWCGMEYVDWIDAEEPQLCECWEDRPFEREVML